MAAASGRRRSSRVKPRGARFKLLLIVLVTLALLACAAVLIALQEFGITPRALAPYVAKRGEGHNPTIVGIGVWANTTLTRLDRGSLVRGELNPALRIGAQRAVAVEAAPGETLVASADEARAALLKVQPGDVITFLPGRYRFQGGVVTGQGGREGAPVRVRARAPGTVTIEMDAEEGFKIATPYWRFENLTIQGVCKSHTDCEHAFHVFGPAHHFVSSNNTILDFNAHFKINGLEQRYPDHGLIEHNTLSNTSVRDTSNPVTPIDIVAASGWVIRNNLITDFVKGDGNLVSYGGFAKGAGAHTTFEQNVVICEQHLVGLKGQRVGLSLGGGGSGGPFCRDGRCVTEQDDSVIRNNLIASCSDDGIYLNSAARSQIVHNTLIDTAGISVRFPTSSADVEGNLIDGAIRSRNGGVVRERDNRSTSIALMYLGWHPVRNLLNAPAALDFAWSGAAPRRGALAEAAGLLDLCGTPRQAQPAYGAFEDFSACVKPVGPVAARTN